MSDTPERQYANELRQMFERATQPASAGMPWEDVIRHIVEAAERFADAKEAQRSLDAADAHNRALDAKRRG